MVKCNPLEPPLLSPDPPDAVVDTPTFVESSLQNKDVGMVSPIVAPIFAPLTRAWHKYVNAITEEKSS